MKYLLSALFVLFMASTVAIAQENILIQGNGSGIFCGVEEGDYVHICVQQGNEKRLVMSGLRGNEEAKVARLKPGDKISFQFSVIEAFIPEAEKKLIFPLITSLSGEGGAPQPSIIEQLFSVQTLNMAIPFLESKIGPAKYVSDSTRSYEVNGCKFQVEGTESVESIRLELSPQCTFNIEKVMGGSGQVMAHQLTFGSFHELAGGGIQYMADCFAGCGNAYDPSVYAFYQGPRSLGGIEIKAQGLLVDGGNIKAADRFADYLLQKEGEDWLSKTMINCDRKYDQEAQEFLRTVKVTAIEMGFQLGKPKCGQ
ncbi:hypothetical protein [Desulfovibrio cuneatus]|uniref:hypothetical protein n=1 Tax=Desulfovibrio cuneatus TaxID=159728 RepID=UPI00040B8A7D|nr:hypothetical protein [Desulfovibrio cuneatus]